MAVERDRRLSGEALELPPQRAFGRTGGGGDFAGSERLGEVTLHEPNGHHDASRGRTLGCHRYIRGKAGCLNLCFIDSDLLSSAALDLPGTSALSQELTQ